MVHYLDTSAAAKLVLVERNSAAMMAWARAHADTVVSSDLLRTELLRATRRAAPDLVTRARAIIDSVVVVGLTASTFERAADLDPESLRSLDALHLAAALEFGDELSGIVTYDERLATAALRRGVAVVAPA